MCRLDRFPLFQIYKAEMKLCVDKFYDAREEKHRGIVVLVVSSPHDHRRRSSPAQHHLHQIYIGITLLTNYKACSAANLSLNDIFSHAT